MKASSSGGSQWQFGVGRRDDRVAGDAGALVGLLDDLVAVDGVAERVAERRVLQRRVAVADRLAGLEVDRAGVEGDLVEARRVAVERGDALLALERLAPGGR